MKVGPMEIVGLVAALRAFVAGDDAADARRWERMLAHIAEPLRGIDGLCVDMRSSPHQPVPQLTLELDADVLGLGAYDAVNALLAGDPAVAVSESRAELGTLIVNPMGLTEDDAEIVRERLWALFRPGSRAG
jgi:seryl-tRNA(Sec) selenium transferase